MKTRAWWSCVLVLSLINCGLLVWLWLTPAAKIGAQPAPARALTDSPRAIPPTTQPALPADPATDALATKLVANAKAHLAQPSDAKKLAGLRDQVENYYGPLYRLLALDEAKFNQLSALLLTRRQVSDQALQSVLATGVIPTPQEVRALEDRANANLNAQIAALLGPEQAPVFADYLTRPSDVRIVDALDAKLSYSEEPLAPATRNSLLQVLHRSGSETDFVAAAGSVLSAAQLAELIKSYDAQASRRQRFDTMRQFLTAAASP